VTTKTIDLGGRTVTRMGLGTNRLTHSPSNVTFIRSAVAAGIGVIDTAHLYTGGESERTIGEALGGASAGKAFVETKGGYSPGEGRPQILRGQIEQSLRSLRTATIDLYYLHRVDPQTPLNDSLGVIREAVDAGEIRAVGLSQVSIAQIERARTIVEIAAVQSHYNLSERGWDDVVDYCTREGIVFVPYFPLRGRHTAAEAIAARHGATTDQIALAWLLHRSPLMLPIPGSLSIDHVRANMAALDIDLDDRELAALA